MAKQSNNQNNAYWQQDAPPPRPQDASTARERLGGTPTSQQQAKTSYGTPQYHEIPQYNTQQPQHPNRPQAYVGTKDHIAAGLLALLFGAFGIHKFYLGYNTAGFIMLGATIIGSLFTLGLAGPIMSLIGVIEGVIYLTKSQPDFDYIYVQNYKEWF